MNIHKYIRRTNTYKSMLDTFIDFPTPAFCYTYSIDQDYRMLHLLFLTLPGKHG